MTTEPEPFVLAPSMPELPPIMLPRIDIADYEYRLPKVIAWMVMAVISGGLWFGLYEAMRGLLWAFL